MESQIGVRVPCIPWDREPGVPGPRLRSCHSPVESPWKSSLTLSVPQCPSLSHGGHNSPDLVIRL